MSGPQIPHIELPELPIPPWSVVALLVVVAGTFFYSMRKRPWDFSSIVFGLAAVAAPIVFWVYIRPTYFLPEDPPTIKPFGTLVALGVYIGSVVAVRHGRDRGLDLDKMNSFIFWVVGLGFVGGHVLDAVFYTPEKLHGDPLYLVKIWAGLSSFGGFTGAMLGAIAYKYFKRDNVLSYVDTVCSAFPLAWVFGRSGCASVHDHPGKISDAWYAVKCVDHLNHGEGNAFLCSSTHGLGRYDLGLIECVLTIPLALAFLFLWARKPRHVGFFAGWMCILYAPVRFVLDFFRAGPGDKVVEVDPRYAGLTPAQWAAFGLVGVGIYVIWLGKRYYPVVPATYEEAQALAAADGTIDEEDADEEDERAPTRAATTAKKTAVASTATASSAGGKKKKKKKKARAVEPASDEASENAKPTASPAPAPEPASVEKKSTDTEPASVEKKSTDTADATQSEAVVAAGAKTSAKSTATNKDATKPEPDETEEDQTDAEASG